MLTAQNTSYLGRDEHISSVGRDVISRELDRLEKWDHVNLLKLSKARCKVLHMSQGKHLYQWVMNGFHTAPRRRIWWMKKEV